MEWGLAGEARRARLSMSWLLLSAAALPDPPRSKLRLRVAHFPARRRRVSNPQVDPLLEVYIPAASDSALASPYRYRPRLDGRSVLLVAILASVIEGSPSAMAVYAKEHTSHLSFYVD
jgi:hypothetical protein